MLVFVFFFLINLYLNLVKQELFGGVILRIRNFSGRIRKRAGKTRSIVEVQQFIVFHQKYCAYTEFVKIFDKSVHC